MFGNAISPMMVLLALPLLAALVILVVVLAVRSSNRQRTQSPTPGYPASPPLGPAAYPVDQATQLLNATFGGHPEVTFKVNPHTLPYQTVVDGARTRGYTLVAEMNDTPDGSAKTLVFARA